MNAPKSVGATQMQTQPQESQAWILQDFMCSKCGKSLEDGYQERHHGTDPETGYQDVELICSECCDAEEEILIGRIEACVYMPDALALAKEEMEAADLQEHI